MRKRKAPIKNPQIGRNLRRLRREQKLSIRAFCARAKPAITPVQLLATELGKREPTINMTIRYARVLGVSMDALTAK